MNDESNGIQDSMAASSSRKITVHVEVRLCHSYDVNVAEVRKQVNDYLLHITYDSNRVRCETNFTPFIALPPFLKENVERIRICEASNGASFVPINHVSFLIHAFHPASHDDLEELMTSDADGAGGALGEENGLARDDDAMAATVLELPNASLDGVWETLVYEDNVKARLLNYIYTTLRYSDANVDVNVIGWNRLLLLHGPPGTGKTSLCRGLAHKLTVRLADRFTYGKLVEINAHSLFSKWFSESGKLVQRLFSLITEMVADEEGLIVVLIDEVESLTAARTNAATNGAEPGDAVRVVNALLTQLDKLKQRKNVLIVTTSNLSESIDDAFLDRADIKQYIGPPPPQAIYQIMHSCLQELVRVGLVATSDTMGDVLGMPYCDTRVQQSEDEIDNSNGTNSNAAGMALSHLARQAYGLSGRTLRRLPVLAHARYLSGLALNYDQPIPLNTWLEAMQRTVLDTRSELQDAGQGNSTKRP